MRRAVASTQKVIQQRACRVFEARSLESIANRARCFRGGGIQLDGDRAWPGFWKYATLSVDEQSSVRRSASMSRFLDFAFGTALAGARKYTEYCAVCHGVPHASPTPIAKGMFPPPPQLFEQLVTTDPEGITFWKVTNGIRMTGMPAFQNPLSDTERSLPGPSSITRR
jgi:hypothetical protein